MPVGAGYDDHHAALLTLDRVYGGGWSYTLESNVLWPLQPTGQDLNDSAIWRDDERIGGVDHLGLDEIGAKVQGGIDLIKVLLGFSDGIYEACEFLQLTKTGSRSPSWGGLTSGNLA